MFKPHIGNCVNCPRTSVPIVVRDGFCDKCNYKRKEDKKRSEGKKTGGYKYVKKATGEKNVFEQVLDNLDEFETRCFICEKRVAVVTHHNFAHILAKGRYPKFRLNPDNIRIMCYNIQGTGCHSRYDFSPKSELTDPMWDKVWQLREKLLNEYKTYNP
jgi:hypothetical protein